jgi:hypothetical protein
MTHDLTALIDRLYDTHQIVIRAFRYREGLQPIAKDPDFDDSQWLLDREFTKSRGSGNVIGWFRATVEVPARVGGFDVTGSAAHLLANIDDYGEIWVDGQMRSPIAGFNVDQRALLSEQVRPGDAFSLALLAVNGYVATPFGGIFIRYARVQFAALESVRSAAEGLVEELRRAERLIAQEGMPRELLEQRLDSAMAKIGWDAAEAGDKAAFIHSLGEARRVVQG